MKKRKTGRQISPAPKPEPRKPKVSFALDAKATDDILTVLEAYTTFFKAQVEKYPNKSVREIALDFVTENTVEV